MQFIAMGSSHREAPLIANDPLADNVDVYAFRSPDNPDMVTLIATYIPMQLPYGGPNYYTFGEDIRYEIRVDNDVNSSGDDIIYRFTFRRENEDPTTFFNIRLGAENIKTTYRLERSLDGGASFRTIVQQGIVPPYNIGPRSIEGGAGLGTSYETLFNDAITTANTGEKVFAGPTDDPFFVDLGGIFDLGNAPRQGGQPVDGLACFNVSALAIQVPISTLLKADAPAEPTSILDPDYVIGVWASASRRAIRTIRTNGQIEHTGLWIQVSRLGMPLTNEVVIPVGSKDFWNTLTPYDEIGELTLDEFFYNPELALYMDDDQFGSAVPAFTPLRIQTNSLGSFDFSNGGDGLYSLKGSDAVAGTALDDAVFGTLLLPAPGKPRSVDLWPAFHTGVPNVIPYQLATGKEGNPLAAGKPFVHNFLPNGGDMLRLNMAVPPTQRDDENFSSLGLVQAAVLGLTAAPFNTNTDIEFIPNMDGFPNGRRLEDDVTRIELQAVAGVVLAAVGLWYDDFDPAVGNPVTDQLLGVLTYTTGVETNDKAFRSSFPYLAMPTAGTDNCFADLFDEGSELETVSQFFTSSNNSGKIGVFSVKTDNSIDYNEFVSAAEDADGIFYDRDSDVLYQLNRTANVINAYSNVLANLESGGTPELTATSTSDFTNGREIAVSGDQLVVAQDANEGNGMTNAFHIYTIAPDSIAFQRTLESPLNLWGIHLDGNTLYAIEDNSDRLVQFDNFFSLDSGMVMADQSVTIESMVRTHGITYTPLGDIMVLTDVGEASSDSDGAFTIITDFAAKAADGIISDDEQIRISGPDTQLGNPVDIAYDTIAGFVYVTERAQDMGKVLAFIIPAASGGSAPAYSKSFPGASAIYLVGDNVAAMDTIRKATFYGSSNTSGLVGRFSVVDDNSLMASVFPSQGSDADGIYYDEENDVLYQLNRTENVINAYSNVESSLATGMVPEVTATSTSDFINGREIAAAGNLLVVVQDANDANNMQNRLLVYEITANEITLVNSYDVDINLWGIYADVNTLYAIVDNSDQLAVFQDFFSNTDGAISPDQTVSVAEMTRTHGITYLPEDDIMVLTDVADAMSDADGAFTVIADFMTAAADGMIAADEQLIVEGDQTQLGNPVDIAYDGANGLIYVAERANEGGKILVFNASDVGNVAPQSVSIFDGASAIYLEGSVGEGEPSTTTAVINVGDASLGVNVFPNPVTESFNLQFEGDAGLYRDSRVDIMTLDGKSIKNMKGLNAQTRISMADLQTGIYLIHIYNDKFDHTIKLNKI